MTLRKDDWQVSTAAAFLEDHQIRLEHWLAEYGYENPEQTAADVLEHLKQ